MQNFTGQQLGNYRLLRLREQSDCADIYEAESLDQQRDVTAHVLRATVSEQIRPQFFAQAEKISQLQHPNIVEVIDLGIQGSTFFTISLPTPYPSLRHLHPRGSCLAEEKILAYVEQIGAALHDAHARQVIHGCLKPEYILSGEKNKLLLTSFALVPLMMQTFPINTSGYNSALQPSIVPYIAPEQVREVATTASDQYGLALLVYEWLCGDVPFRGTVQKVIRQHLEDLPAPLSRKVPGLSPYLEEAIIIALAKHPQDRFQSIQAFVTALQSVIHHPLQSIDTEGTFRIPQRPYWLDLQRQDPTLQTASDMSTFVAPHSNSSSLTQQEQDIHTFLRPPAGISPVEQKVSRPAEHDVAVQRAPVQPLIPPKQQALSRRALVGGLIGVGALIGTAVTVLAVQSLHTSQKSTLASPSPAQAGVPRIVTPVSLAVLGSTITIFQGHRDQVFSLAWSPDTKFIASGSADTSVQIWRSLDGGSILNYQGHNDLVLAVDWAPDGTRVASSGRDTTVQIWNPMSGKVSFTYTQHTNQVHALSWSPDSTALLSTGNDHTLRLWHAADGTSLFHLRLSQLLHAVAWSPQGNLLAVGGEDTSVTLYDTDGKVVTRYREHSARVRALAWSADGRQIASASDDHTVCIWDASKSQLVYRYTAHHYPVSTVSWSADDRRIASSSLNTIHIWEAATGKLLYVYSDHPLSVSTLHWSPSGPWIASGGVDQTIRVWKGMS